MQRVAFKMKLFPGNEAAYQQGHDAIWPELVQLLKEAGISEYSIFLDSQTHTLFGVLQVADKAAMDALPHQPVMQKWWAYMSDLMETNADGSPVSVPLQEVFYMP